jgi:uncharacterized membrane protein
MVRRSEFHRRVRLFLPSGICREAGGEIALHEAIGLSGEREMPPTYRRTLLTLLFAPGSLTGAGGGVTSAELAKIGIDATFRSRFAEQVRAETSALFVLITRPAIRDSAREDTNDQPSNSNAV